MLKFTVISNNYIICVLGANLLKKTIGLIVIFIMVLSASCVFAEVDDNVSVRINGELIESNDKNYIVNDRVFVLARDVAESLGAIVEWQNATKEVTMRLDNQIISFNIDSFTADVDGEIKVMDTMPFLKNERTYVPVRFLSENLGFSVQWDGIDRIVDISSDDTLISRSDLDVQHSYTKEDLLWLSRIVQVETGGSTIDMKLAVANVVLNRVASNIFPNNIHDVIFEIDVYIQFPPAHRESFVTLIPSELSIEAARRAFEGENNISDCLYFNNSPFKTKTDDLYKIIDGEYFYH